MHHAESRKTRSTHRRMAPHPRMLVPQACFRTRRPSRTGLEDFRTALDAMDNNTAPPADFRQLLPRLAPPRNRPRHSTNRRTKIRRTPRIHAAIHGTHHLHVRRQRPRTRPNRIRSSPILHRHLRPALPRLHPADTRRVPRRRAMAPIITSASSRCTSRCLLCRPQRDSTRRLITVLGQPSSCRAWARTISSRTFTT